MNDATITHQADCYHEDCDEDDHDVHGCDNDCPENCDQEGRSVRSSVGQ